MLVESRRGGKQKHDADVLARSAPTPLKGGMAQLRHPALGRICHPDRPVGEAVNGHEMILLPMDNKRGFEVAQARLGFLPTRERHPESAGLQTNAFGSFHDAQHADPFLVDKTGCTQLLQRIVAAVVGGYHPQAGRSAIYGI